MNSINLQQTLKNAVATKSCGRSKSPKYLFLMFLALLLWLPLPLGSNRPWAWAIMEIWIFIIAITWLTGFCLAKFQINQAVKNSLPAIICWFLWLLIATIQFLPIPLGVITALSPKLAAIQQQAGLWQTYNMLPASIDSHAAFTEWLKGVAYLLIFIMTLLLVEGRKRIKTLAWVLVCSGVLQSIIGIALIVSNSSHSSASGTFINPNHYANYLIMTMAVGIGLILSGLNEQKEKRYFKQFIIKFLRVLFSYKTPLRIFLVTIVSAIITSHSRMGNASLIIGLFIAGLISLQSYKKQKSTIAIILLSFILLDLLLIGSWVGLDKVVKRIEATKISQEIRVQVVKDTLNLSKDFWITGSGMGSFSTIYPRYKSHTTKKHFRHADNDYLEFLSETGIVGFLLLGIPILLSLKTAIKLQQKSQDPLIKGLSFTVTMATTAMLIHATTDYNLHMPANAATFMVLLALPSVLMGNMVLKHNKKVIY
ncbi:MAG: O-antigen ligase family protein [Magnetococcales bacterium]|nr:O-antigen ligase family protein [Magnetococcales bacterium]